METQKPAAPLGWCIVEIPRAELGAAVGMNSTGGGFGNYLSELRTNALMEDRGGGYVVHHALSLRGPGGPS